MPLSSAGPQPAGSAWQVARARPGRAAPRRDRRAVMVRRLRSAWPPSIIFLKNIQLHRNSDQNVCFWVRSHGGQPPTWLDQKKEVLVGISRWRKFSSGDHFLRVGRAVSWGCCAAAADAPMRQTMACMPLL